jgi:CDP-glucose 4,6-dehydratase
VAVLGASGRVVDERFWKGKRVFVTGHTGFKGGWLTLWLSVMGAEVVGLSNGRPTDPCLFDVAGLATDVASVEADVRDFDSIERAVRDFQPEVVLHLAAQPLVRLSYQDPVSTYATNVMGAVHVLEAVRRVRTVRVVVNVTSDKCYENREWEWGYRENEPIGGRDPYSSSKGCAELVTAAYRSSFFGALDSAAIASARAGNVIGGGDWGADRLVPDVMRAALSGAPVRIRNPQAVRPWQHVLNSLSGYLLLAQRLWHSREFATAWNFGPTESEARTVAWMVERTAALWGSNIQWERDSDEQTHEAHVLKLDSSRARERLGWKPNWELEQGLTATVDWYRAYRDEHNMRAFSLAQIGAYQATSVALAGI